MAADDTSIRVSRVTLAEISRLQKAIGAPSADQALRALMKMKRGELLAAIYGTGRGKVRRFREADRLDVDH
jgi:hypothetical protein